MDLSDWSCQITWKSHKKTLLWKHHIDNVAKKIKESIWNGNQIREYTDLKTLRLIYHSIFELDLSYSW